MNEHGLTNNVRTLLTALVRLRAPLYFLKIHGSVYQKANQPDWFICIAGLLYQLETKHPDEACEPDPGQAHEFKKWIAAGAKLVILNDLNDIKAWLLKAFKVAYFPTPVPQDILLLLQPKNNRIT